MMWTALCPPADAAYLATRPSLSNSRNAALNGATLVMGLAPRTSTPTPALGVRASGAQGVNSA
eukprot:5871788-Alexandrium_andersonii.AAC.1